MFWLLVLLLVGYAMLLPVTLTLRHEHMRLCLQLRFLCLHKTWALPGLNSAVQSLRQNRRTHFYSYLWNAAGARRFFLKHAHLIRLDALLVLSSANAARTALLTGLLRSLTASLASHHVNICIQPDFLRPHAALRFQCMIQWKMGTLLMTILIMLAAKLTQRHQESEAMEYGTSHR